MRKKKRSVPFLLQEISVASMFVLVVGLFFFVQHHGTIIEKLNLTATVYPAVLADLANSERTSENVTPLAWNATLAQVAEQKGEDMMKNNYFAHTSPSGLTPWYWFAKNNYAFSYAGENLAIYFSQTTDVENAWLNSPEHKANIVDPHFTQVGIAAVDGTFQGQATTIVVEDFGTPTPDSSVEIPAPTKSAPIKQVAIKNPSEVPAPAVKGASIQTIAENTNYISVKNTAAVAPEKPTFYDRFLVNPTNTVRDIYFLLIAIVLGAMILLLRKEYERHHLKHFAMGTGLVVTMVACLLFLVR